MSHENEATLTKKSVQKLYKMYTKIIQNTKFVYILYTKIVQIKICMTVNVQKMYITFLASSLHIYEKSHTCGESGAHLRISFWYLLMNLKNKLLLKKLLKWANKNKIILIFTMLHFFKKI